jgi:hypothetical protein
MGAEGAVSEEEEQGHDNVPLLGGKEVRISVSPDGADQARFTFRVGPRPWHDTAFSILFIATVLVTYAFGFFAVRNAEWDQEALLRFARFNPESGRCESIHHAYVGNTPTHVAVVHKASEGAAVILAPVVSTVVIIPLVGLIVIWLLHRYTREIVLAVFALMFAIPVTVAVVLSTVCLSSKTACSQAAFLSMSMPAQCSVVILITLSFMTLIQFVMVCKNRSRLDLAVQILKTALQALKQNLSLLLLSPVLSLAAFAVNVPICVFMWHALFNGKVSPNFDVIRDPSFACSQATGAPCCQIKPPGWVTPYLILACKLSPSHNAVDRACFRVLCLLGGLWPLSDRSVGLWCKFCRCCVSVGDVGRQPASDSCDQRHYLAVVLRTYGLFYCWHYKAGDEVCSLRIPFSCSRFKDMARGDFEHMLESGVEDFGYVVIWQECGGAVVWNSLPFELDDHDLHHFEELDGQGGGEDRTRHRLGVPPGVLLVVVPDLRVFHPLLNELRSDLRRQLLHFSSSHIRASETKLAVHDHR